VLCGVGRYRFQAIRRTGKKGGVAKHHKLAVAKEGNKKKDGRKEKDGGGRIFEY
jgi:hypothetical protein